MSVEPVPLARELARVLCISLASAEVLVGRGFASLEELAYIPQEELIVESGLPESETLDIRRRARRLLLLSAQGPV